MSGVFALLSLCLSAEPSAAGPRGCPVLYLAGRLLTVSAVSPYTDEWEVSRPFPKLSFPCSNASSRGTAKKTRAAPLAHHHPSRGAPTEMGMEAKFKTLPLKVGGGGMTQANEPSETDMEDIIQKKAREKEKETARRKKGNPLNSEHENIRPVGVWRGVWNRDEID